MTTHPPLLPSAKAHLVLTLQNAYLAAQAMPVQTPCRSCEHYAESADYCRHWKDGVPAEAQPVGCDAFTERLPFEIAEPAGG